MKIRIHQPLRSWPWLLRRNFFKDASLHGIDSGGAQSLDGDREQVNRPEVPVSLVMAGKKMEAHAAEFVVLATGFSEGEQQTASIHA